jgi:isoleucyl-tRNA synthetase
MQPWVDSAVQERLADKEVLKEGNKEVLRMLEERASVLRVDEYKHRYPYDWKTNKPVILLATPQWFADLSRIKDDALRVLKSVHFYPSAGARDHVFLHVI